jgi:lipopolysaccharide heptosyltransferase II
MHVRSRKKRIFAWFLNIFLYLSSFSFRLFNLFKAPLPINNPSSFLIVRLDHIGDVILSTPIYHSLKERFPNARITVLCGSWAADLLSNNPFVDSIIILDCPWWASIRSDAGSGKGFLRQLYKTISNIRTTQYDVFIDLRGDIRHIFLFGWLPNIPVRISYTRSGGGFLLTHPHQHENGHHEIARNYNLLSSFEPLRKYWKTEVYTKNDHHLTLQTKIGKALNINQEPFAVIFNGGRSKLRRLSRQKIAEICRMLHQNYSLKCCYVGDQNDYPDGDETKSLLGADAKGFNNLCGLINFMELKDLISCAKLFIGTDSSVLHLSASTDTPSIALYGPLPAKETMPIGDSKRVVYHQYSCSPCLQEVCTITESKNISQCMADISVEEIMRNVSELLNKRAS